MQHLHFFIKPEKNATAATHSTNKNPRQKKLPEAK
jgi:hypothetical protein